MLFMGLAIAVVLMYTSIFQIRHSAIRTLFQSISSHGHQLSTAMWEHCIGALVFPMVDTVRTLVSVHVCFYLLKVFSYSDDQSIT